MTQAELEQLSRDVADKYGIDWVELGYQYNTFTGNYELDETENLWLHDDSARCFDLFAEHEIDINNYGNWVQAVGFNGDFSEYAKNHNNDKSMTARVAGLRALLAKDKP